MENGRASTDPTYVLKVHLKCCNACPTKIKRKLLRLSGVYAVAMDKEEGLVKVSGRDNLDPSTLVKTVAKVGKVAEFCSFEKKTNAMDSDQPNNLFSNADEIRNNGGYQNGNSGSGNFIDHHGRSSQVHINEAAAVNPPVAPHYRNRPFMRPPSQFGGVSFHGNHGFWPRMSMSEPLPPPPPPILSVPPPMPPAYNNYRWLQPPTTLPPCCYPQQPPPVVNAPTHYFNDDNVEGCTIV